jgi:hypothetical protein
VRSFSTGGIPMSRSSGLGRPKYRRPMRNSCIWRGAMGPQEKSGGNVDNKVFKVDGVPPTFPRSRLPRRGRLSPFPLGEGRGARRWDPRKSRGGMLIIRSLNRSSTSSPAWPPPSVPPWGKAAGRGDGTPGQVGGNVDNTVFESILDLSAGSGGEPRRGAGAPLPGVLLQSRSWGEC